MAKILKGFGVDVKEGDYISVIHHDTGYYGTKGPISFKERGILKVVSFQLRGLPRMFCEDSKGHGVRLHYRSSEPINWYREFLTPTKRQIEQFKKTRAKYHNGERKK